MNPLSWHSWRRQMDQEAEREIIAMATGHRIKVPNVTKNKETGEIEFHAPKKKLPPHVKAIKAKKRTFKKGKRI